MSEALAPTVYEKQHILSLRQPATIFIKGESVNATQALRIVLNSHVHNLPMVQPPKAPVEIGWFDPDPGTRDEIREKNLNLAVDSAFELAARIGNETKVVVVPNSSKSTFMLQLAVDIANNDREDGNKIEFIVLEGGSDHSGVENSTSNGGKLARRTYKPVTEVEKSLGISSENLTRLKSASPDGEGILIMDDVVSTFATLEMIQEFLNDIYIPNDIYRSIEPKEFPALVVMREREVGPDGNEILPFKRLREVFVAPVIFVGFSA